MDNIFIRALVQAGSCPQHTRHTSPCRDPIPLILSHHKVRRKCFNTRPQSRSFATNPPPRNIIRHAVDVTRSELKRLVDFYSSDFHPGDEDEEAEYLTEETKDIKLEGSFHRPWKLDSDEDWETINSLERLLKNDETPHTEIFAMYQQLPYPRVPFLHINTIRHLLHHLAVVERHDQPAMQRYLSILDDMKIASIPIIRSEWTSALAFAGRGARSGPVTEAEVQSMLHVWKEMEADAGIEASNVTFNVLFDTAFKAGRYDLAQAFLKEIAKRKLPVTRYLRTSLIHYHGRRQDGNAVRTAYANLVAAGDIVDTVVLNCVISALFRAREPAAAEAVFLRMKSMHAAKEDPTSPPIRWRIRRKLGLEMNSEGRYLSAVEEKARALAELGIEEGERQMQELTSHRQVLQNTAPIAPDATTYALVIRYHAQSAGNIDRVVELLHEMRSRDITPDGLIFLPIIKGFDEFGGVRYTSWTADRLEFFFEEFIEAVDRGEQNSYLSQSSAALILRAFARTAPGRVLEVWEEMRGRWGPDEGEVDSIYRLLRRLVPNQLTQEIKTANVGIDTEKMDTDSMTGDTQDAGDPFSDL